MNSNHFFPNCIFISAWILITTGFQTFPGAIFAAQASPTSTSSIPAEVLQSSMDARQLWFDRKGVTLLLDSDPNGAVDAFNELLASNPSDIFALNNRANEYMQIGATNQALADYNHAIFLDNSKEFLYFNRAIAHTRASQVNEAIADYTTALYLNPQDVRSLTNRGTLYVKLANFPAALADYDAALKIEPKLARATYNRAHTRRRARDRDGALADYRMASKLLREQGFDTESLTAEKLAATLQEEVRIGQVP
jgi:tetratricopeptide (TPR) repeat protein